MSVVNWGLLAKSLEDNETIEEAIVRLVAEHNEDEESHLGSGQSLQSHKASAIIDHLAASIIADKIKDWEVVNLGGSFDRIDFHWLSFFESIDGFAKIITGSGAVTLEDFYVQLSTGATIDSWAGLAEMIGISTVFNWDSKRKFRTKVLFSSHQDQVIHLFTGIMDVAPEQRHMGFRIVDNLVYGDVADGTDRTLLELPMSIGPGDIYDFELKFYPGEKVEFYVNGVLKGTITTNLPSGDTDADGIMVAQVVNSAAADKYIRFSYWDFWQAT